MKTSPRFLPNSLQVVDPNLPFTVIPVRIIYLLHIKTMIGKYILLRNKDKLKNILNLHSYGSHSSHQSVYSNMPTENPTRSYQHLGQNVALMPAKIPLYQPLRNYEAVGMTFGEHLVHNARHQVIPHGKITEIILVDLACYKLHN